MSAKVSANTLPYAEPEGPNFCENNPMQSTKLKEPV